MTEARGVLFCDCGHNFSDVPLEVTGADAVTCPKCGTSWKGERDAAHGHWNKVAGLTTTFEFTTAERSLLLEALAEGRRVNRDTSERIRLLRADGMNRLMDRLAGREPTLPPCALCDGTGRVSVDPRSECPGCDATGRTGGLAEGIVCRCGRLMRVPGWPPNRTEVTCPNCGATWYRAVSGVGARGFWTRRFPDDRKEPSHAEPGARVIVCVCGTRLSPVGTETEFTCPTCGELWGLRLDGEGGSSWGHTDGREVQAEPEGA